MKKLLLKGIQNLLNALSDFGRGASYALKH